MNFGTRLYLGAKCLCKTITQSRIQVVSLAQVLSERNFCSEDTPNDPSEITEAQDNEPTKTHKMPEWTVNILTKHDDVLRAFNSLNPHQLCKYRHVSMRLGVAIQEDREVRGPFRDLTELTRVRGLGRRTLDRFVAEGLRPRGIRIEPLTRYAYAVSGNEQIPQEKLKVLDSIVTMDVGLKHFAWLHMDRGRHVIEWRVVDLVDISPAKYDPIAYFKAMQRVLDEVPTSDMYILEHKSFAMTTKTAYQVILFLRTLESLIFGMLNANYADTGDLECVSISQQRVGKHFGLIVGTRRRSGQAIVKSLLKRGLSEENQKVVVKFRPEDAEMFENANNFEKELLANTVLKAVSFFDNMIDNADF
ncbi:Transcription elongation factor, mitochondrial [Holothuria leucospilota]|uniref:Transcription elongation factor, mitochondrial n=1 Tax=Holothuria leucospilota TaxID=206669 RepID=A0A9Q1C4G3_HOLLE|nr:Transcription elongation factor, mitochondrial [Holothuria leucospilota]